MGTTYNFVGFHELPLQLLPLPVASVSEDLVDFAAVKNCNSNNGFKRTRKKGPKSVVASEATAERDR